MNAAIYQARRELLNALQLPSSQTGFRMLRRRQQIKLFVWESGLSSMYAVKRLMDILLASTTMLLFAPFFLLVALAICLEDGFPVFYVQKRVGLHGKEFWFYKFRSMYRDADRRKEALTAQNDSRDGVIFKMRHDPRVTRVGHIIRRFSIDELPQVLNVLLGDLAIVGPRPPLPREVAQYTLAERKRLHVKPGLTCLWQIQGRSEIPFKQQVRLDLQYIQSQSIWKDLRIILKTVPAVLLGKGAY
jgi:lipopolysaccharide/colanic/teichoic acid biosynthesis glycosyltransferase